MGSGGERGLKPKAMLVLFMIVLQIYGRRGLVYASEVSEYQHLCERLTWVPLNDVSSLNS